MRIIFHLPFTLFLVLSATAGAGTRVREKDFCAALVSLVPIPATVRGAALRFAEAAVNFQTRDHTYTDRTFTFGEPGAEIELLAGERFGRGFYGRIYHASIVRADDGARAAFPALFKHGTPGPIVMKFPQAVTWPLPRAPFVRSVRDETIDTTEINEDLRELGFDPIPGTEILASREGTENDVDDPPIIVKWFFQGDDVNDLAVAQRELTFEQASAMEPMYLRAKALYDFRRTSVDLKPLNFAWNRKTGQWGMYETTHARGAGNFFVSGGPHGLTTSLNIEIANRRGEIERMKKKESRRRPR